MSRRFIIHTGPAKTGTSSLQEALFNNRQALARAGFHYPVLGRNDQMPRLPGHHGIPAVLKSGGALPEEFLDWAASLPQTSTIVLSSENLAHLSAAQIRQLAAQTCAEQVDVVYYARRWDRLLPSIWQELVKHGESRGYQEFLTTQTEAPRASFYLNYALPLDRWADVFGQQAMRLYSYDNILASGGDIVTHFFQEVLAQDPPCKASGGRTNPRMAPMETEMMRALNRLSFGQEQGNPGVRQKIVKGKCRITRDMAVLSGLMQPFLRLCRPCAPLALHAVEDDLLQRYGSRIGNPASGGRLFEVSSFDPAEFCCADYLMIPEAAAALRRIHRALGLPSAV